MKRNRDNLELQPVVQVIMNMMEALEALRVGRFGILKKTLELTSLSRWNARQADQELGAVEFRHLWPGPWIFRANQSSQVGCR
jgi:hypothetical protein